MPGIGLAVQPSSYPSNLCQGRSPVLASVLLYTEQVMVIQATSGPAAQRWRHGEAHPARDQPPWMGR